jgi:hypothetical protein
MAASGKSRGMNMAASGNKTDEDISSALDNEDESDVFS